MSKIVVLVSLVELPLRVSGNAVSKMENPISFCSNATNYLLSLLETALLNPDREKTIINIIGQVAHVREPKDDLAK